MFEFANGYIYFAIQNDYEWKKFDILSLKSLAFGKAVNLVVGQSHDLKNLGILSKIL